MGTHRGEHARVCASARIKAHFNPPRQCLNDCQELLTEFLANERQREGKRKRENNTRRREPSQSSSPRPHSPPSSEASDEETLQDAAKNAAARKRQERLERSASKARHLANRLQCDPSPSRTTAASASEAQSMENISAHRKTSPAVVPSAKVRLSGCDPLCHKGFTDPLRYALRLQARSRSDLGEDMISTLSRLFPDPRSQSKQCFRPDQLGGRSGASVHSKLGEAAFVRSSKSRFLFGIALATITRYQWRITGSPAARRIQGGEYAVFQAPESRR